MIAIDLPPVNSPAALVVPADNPYNPPHPDFYSPSDADLRELAKFYDDRQDVSAWWLPLATGGTDYDEMAARADEAYADLTPCGADCPGFTLGGAEQPHELTYEMDDAGVMFLDQPDEMYA